MALTLGTGVGSCFVVDNSPVESGDTVPDHGWVYCLPFESGIVDEAFSTRWLCRQYTLLTGRVVDGVKAIVDAGADDERVKALFADYGRRLGQFVVPVLRRFGGNVLLLGGNISRTYSLFKQGLQETLQQSDYRCDVRISSLLGRAAMMGAASLFLNEEK
jgi:glucokinase